MTTYAYYEPGRDRPEGFKPRRSMRGAPGPGGPSCMQMDREAWAKAGKPEPVPCTCGFWAALAREDGGRG